MTESRAVWRKPNERAGGPEDMRAGLKAVQRWCDEVAGDTLARGLVDKGESRVDQLIGWPVGQTKAFRVSGLGPQVSGSGYQV